jgi:hypothetical protein
MYIYICSTSHTQQVIDMWEDEAAVSVCLVKFHDRFYFCIHTHTHTHTHKHTYTHTHIYIYVYIYVSVYVCVCV